MSAWTMSFRQFIVGSINALRPARLRTLTTAPASTSIGNSFNDTGEALYVQACIKGV